MIDSTYQPQAVETQAQAEWQAKNCFKAVEDPSKEKFYCLSMFPYPSGRLHMGHVRNYTIGDVVSRYQRMKGKNVLQPMGFDAFGLPAENAAMKSGRPPAEWTYSNIAYMVQQLKALGLAYDWDRQIDTCRPSYYRWEQWFFIQLYKKGLVYRKNSVVNWDPIDQTVLANEQVIDGKGWRSGAVVEQREIPQWFMRISDYADELLQDLNQLPDWPEAVRTMQENWIGKSKGLEIDFLLESGESITVFTTRPDTLHGVTYLAVAAQHPLALQVAETNPALAAFIEDCRKTGVSEAALATAEKKGFPLGIDVIHPLTGEKVPVWAANFVLMNYGTGAVMAVPAHDQRDWEFASAYGIAKKAVIALTDGSLPDISAAAYTDKGADFEAVFSQMQQALGASGRLRVNYRLRDWGVSRQRYWGCPIPMIHCPHCGPVPVPEDQLPVVLPEDLMPDGSGSPLARSPAFYETTCPSCGSPARRETDTFDTFFESSWYYARFACPDADAMLDERARYWLPVDQYVGGIEHAILHLLYARFFHKLMRDVGLPVPSAEPFQALLTQGMVGATAFFRKDDAGKETWYAVADLDLQHDDKNQLIAATLKADGQPVQIGRREKMSKSKNNGIDPESMIAQHGADAVRMFMMFASPPDQGLDWNDAGLEGATRFLKRLWVITHQHAQSLPVAGLDASSLTSAQKDLRRALHTALAKMEADMGRRLQFNTVVAASMELVNALYKFDDPSPQGVAVRHEVLSALVRALSPIVPHICHALWQVLGEAGMVIDAVFPVCDPAALVSDSQKLVVQVNGKLKGQIEVPVGASAEAVLQAALLEDSIQRALNGLAVKKPIYVVGKLLNLVV
jgi:leucyl-tRNA synthetase